MHYSSLPKTDQAFTHIDPDTGEQTTFAASALRRWCETFRQEIVLTPITLEVAKMIANHRGLEAKRLRRAMNSKRFLPLLYLIMPDRSHLLIDGSHSYIAIFKRGTKYAESYMVGEHIWKNFIVEGVPKVTEKILLNSDSMLP